MAADNPSGPTAPGNPLAVLVELDPSFASLRVLADQDAGVVRVVLAAWPRPQRLRAPEVAAIVLAPEVAVELAAHLAAVALDLGQGLERLLARVQDLRHGK